MVIKHSIFSKYLTDHYLLIFYHGLYVVFINDLEQMTGILNKPICDPDHLNQIRHFQLNPILIWEFDMVVWIFFLRDIVKDNM